MARVLAFVAAAGCNALPPTVEYEVPSQTETAIVQSMTPGPDGNIWFTYTTIGSFGVGNGRRGAIASITTAGIIHEFMDPQINNPLGIAAGLDGALWFTDDDEIGRITIDGQVTKFPLPGTHALRICEGLDRKLWFTETEDRIGSIDLNGNITEFPLPFAGAGLQGIAASGDGNWFVEGARNRIGRMSLAGKPTVSEYAIPTPQSGAQAIALGPDGNFWFTEQAAGKIGRIAPDGTITEFSLSPSSRPAGIAAGPDGNVWYGSTVGPPIHITGIIGRITPSGSISEFLIKDYADINWLAFGVDGNLWFTEPGTIGRLKP